METNKLFETNELFKATNDEHFSEEEEKQSQAPRIDEEAQPSTQESIPADQLKEELKEKPVKEKDNEPESDKKQEQNQPKVSLTACKASSPKTEGKTSKPKKDRPTVAEPRGHTSERNPPSKVAEIRAAQPAVSER